MIDIDNVLEMLLKIKKRYTFSFLCTNILLIFWAQKLHKGLYKCIHSVMQTRNDNRNYNEQHFSLEKHPRIQPSTYRQKKALKRRKCY